MPIYASAEQLYRVMQELFRRLPEKDPAAVRSVAASRMVLRMRTSSPVVEVCINGRHNPLQIIYGAATLRPDIELELPADLLHAILMSEISLRKAHASGKIRLRGPIWRALSFEPVFTAGQLIYPQILAEMG
ncbi:MAG: hypothetical protein MUE67_00250 [Anaerolineales bacterium]|jgi:hypothetical protein|nr:hypothetical protein [Anaerolineales bacterium]